MENAKASLMIDTRQLQRLAMDGPALSIRLQQQSPRLFPLRRLARVHIIGELHCGFEALMHCAEQQIPVAFFTSRGKLRCQLYYPRVDNGILTHWLDHVEFDPEVAQEYQQWLEHQLLHTLSTLGYRQGGCPERQQLIEQQLRTTARQLLADKHRFHDAIDWLEGFLVAHLSQLISAHGMGKNSRAARRLLDDILPIFTIAMLHTMIARLQAKKPFFTNARGMSDFYHQHSELVSYNLQRMLTQLASRLEALV